MYTQLPIPGPLDLGTLLDRAFRLYRAHFVTLLLTAAVFTVPLGLVSGLLTGRFITGYLRMLEALMTDPTDMPAGAVFGGIFGNFAGFFGLTFLLSIVGLLVNGIVTLALAAQSAAILHGEALPLGQGLRRGARRLWTLVGMTVMQWVSYLAVSFAVMIPVLLFYGAVMVGGIWAGAALGGDTDSPIVIIGAVILLIGGYLLFFALSVAPTLYLSSRWIAATPGLVIQGWGAAEALRRSWRLTRGQVWRCLGYRVLLLLLMGLVLSAPLALFQQVAMLLLPPAALGLVTAISTALSSVVNVLWQPFYVGALVLLYYDLRVRREGYDLALQVERLETELKGEQGG